MVYKTLKLTGPITVSKFVELIIYFLIVYVFKIIHIKYYLDF
jgi:hypothetical protein